MAIFDFGKKQRLHTQMIGNTTGTEMFRIDEYNQRKKATFGLGFGLAVIFTGFYFGYDKIPTKISIFLILIAIGLGIGLYFNIKNQLKLRAKLY